MSTVCCVCQEQLSAESNKKNVFSDDLLINSYNSDKSETRSDVQQKIKLYSGIELITGHQIFEAGRSPLSVCESCFQKLEDLINFRAQLMSSFGIMFNEQSSFNPFKLRLDTQIEKDQETVKNSEYDLTTDEILDCPKLPGRKLSSEDVLNVDGNSTTLDSNDVRNEEEETNDSTNCSRLQNDQDNNNLNDSDSSNSNDNIDVQNYDESPFRVQENDIESEIDVCSGDDDEILEVEDESRKDKIIEQSSSESEIEICDYEPTGKKIKNVNALSSLVPF